MAIMLSQIVIKVNRIHFRLWITIVSTNGQKSASVLPGNFRAASFFLLPKYFFMRHKAGF